MPQGSVLEAIRSMPDEVPEPNRTLGWEVVAWATNYLQHPQQAEGTPWILTREQLRILLRWYGIDEAGRFVYRRGVLRRLKGWGKDPFAATISCIELCGPCRFSHFDEKTGMPVAKPHPAPWIQVAAVSKTQTRNTMLLLPGMISQRMIADYQIDIGKEIIYANRGRGQIQAVTSSARALEGSRPSFVILNETHHWLQGNEGHAMADGIRRNLGKASDGQARSLEITNAHLPDEDSVAETTYEGWRQAGGNLHGVMYDSLEAPPVEDLQDHDAVVQALVLARGDSSWLDADRLADEIADPATPDGMARRFYLNQVTKLGGNWLPDGTWDNISRPGKVVPRGSRVVLALDGSFNGDSTALVAASVESTPHLQVVDCWEAPAENPHWRVNIADVEEAIREACRRWNAIEVVYDPYRWQRSAEALESEGLPMVEFPQSPQRMSPATSGLYEAVINELVTHDGDFRLARHVQNATLKQDSRGTRIVKETKGSPKKIDLAVTAIMAHSRAAAIAVELDDEERCQDCGGVLNSRGACEVCAPQVFSIREELGYLQGAQLPAGVIGSGMPVVTQHTF